MLKFIRIGSFVIAAILIIATIALIALQSLASILAIATAVLFIYYLLIAIATLLIKNNFKIRPLEILLIILFGFPILWSLIHPESLFELLMGGIKLDMK